MARIQPHPGSLKQARARLLPILKRYASGKYEANGPKGVDGEIEGSDESFTIDPSPNEGREPYMSDRNLAHRVMKRLIHRALKKADITYSIGTRCMAKIVLHPQGRQKQCETFFLRTHTLEAWLDFEECMKDTCNLCDIPVRFNKAYRNRGP